MNTERVDVALSKSIEDSIILSVIIPVFNEQGSIQLMKQRLSKVMESINLSYEVILIDDGSTDNTWQFIENVVHTTPHWRGVKLSRNFGHQPALLAGMSLARGRAIITMDGDLQHPPELLPDLVQAWRQGFSIVNTRRIQEQQTLTPFKRLTSNYFYMIFSLLSGVKINQGSSDFRLIDRQVLNEILKFNDADVFLRGAVQWLGFSNTTIDFSVQKRLTDVSKFNLKRMLYFAVGAIISFSTKPLHLGIWIGILMSFLAFAELIFILIQYFLGNTVPGWASILGFMSLLFGVLFIILGIIGLYLSRIYQVLQAHPKFVVAKIIRNDAE